MKIILCLPCLLVIACLSIGQVKPDGKLNALDQLQQTVENEKQAHELLFSGQRDAAVNGFSVASGNFDVNFYRCEWTVDPAIRYIAGKVTCYFTMLAADNNIVLDLSDTLTVDSVTYRGQPVSFQRPGNDGLGILFPATIALRQKDSVSVYYHGVPRINGTSYLSFRQGVIGGTMPVLCTLSEPYGAKEWWPCKNGLTDKADSLDVVLSNPSSYQGSTNGVMASETISGSQKTSYWKHRYPIATYLVAFSVTNYMVLTDSIMMGGKPMNLIDYVYPGYNYNFDASRVLVKNALNLYARLFGDYPFAKEKYGFTQFIANGGMEHQTNSFVSSSEGGTMIHETAHQWFGDKITCGSWQDIWLNEGFATYLQILYNENYNGAYINYLTLNNFRKVVISQPGGSVWVNDTTTSTRVFDGRLSYYKGAFILHTLRWKLGDSVFFRGMRRYFNDPAVAYGFSRTADFKRDMEAESGRDLTPHFQQWFYGEGYPTYFVQWSQDDSNRVFLKINQSTSHPSVSFYDVPLEIEFKSSTRDTILVFNNTKNGQSFLANPGFIPDTLISDPHYWMVSGNNTSAKTNCGSIDASDSLLPFYNIRWMQNANTWIKLDVAQTNPGADSAARNIPLFLHFSGDGHDTVITINNAYGSGAWLNIGFKATSAYVVPGSCLLARSYALTGNNASAGSNEIKIFPVPLISNNLSISLKNPTDKTLQVRLYDIAGRLIYQGAFDTPGRDELLNVSLPPALAKGTYIVRLNSEKNIRIARKIIR